RTGNGGTRQIKYAGHELFWVTATAVLRQSVDVAGGKPDVVASGQNGLVGVTSYKGMFVFTSSDDGTLVGAKDMGGGSFSTEVLASGQSEPHGIADDGESLFWTNHGT